MHSGLCRVESDVSLRQKPEIIFFDMVKGLQSFSSILEMKGVLPISPKMDRTGDKKKTRAGKLLSEMKSEMD